MKLKIGDEVLVTAGKDKGKKGKVDRILPRTSQVTVAGINLYKKHSKSTTKVRQAGIIDIIRPISVGNVALVCPKCKMPTRIGYATHSDKKRRVCNKCDEIID
jgi:large subunit ribosomal protein L24